METERNVLTEATDAEVRLALDISKPPAPLRWITFVDFKEVFQYEESEPRIIRVSLKPRPRSKKWNWRWHRKRLEYLREFPEIGEEDEY
jgi:hypothetical protein